MEKLAIFGGRKTKTKPFGSGKRIGEDEIKEILEALDSDILFYVFGTKVKQMEKLMISLYGIKYCSGCSSGTAAVHIALGSLQLAPGTEVITSSVTDMGSLTGILYQLLIPRFADIDPETYNMDPGSVESLINGKTGAILVVHHAGLPAELDSLMKIAAKHNLPLIEDCAQAHYTKYKGKLCGTFGDVSAFSLNHFKLITTGSGGIVMTGRKDLEENIRLFIDKCYFRDGRERNPYFLAPNYQMSELQGAVAIGQLKKIESIVERRNKLGMRLVKGLAEIKGIIPQKIPEYSTHSFFLLVVRIDPDVIRVPVKEFCRALEAEGIPSKPNMITGGMPVYLYDIFQNRSAFPKSMIPFVSEDLGSNLEYQRGLCPNAENAFEHTFNLNITEFYTEEDIDDMIRATTKVSGYYERGKR